MSPGGVSDMEGYVTMRVSAPALVRIDSCR
jgi:hypothetical protein